VVGDMECLRKGIIDLVLRLLTPRTFWRRLGVAMFDVWHFCTPFKRICFDTTPR
jgi:hypothetical protein